MKKHPLTDFRKNAYVWILLLYFSVIGLALLIGWCLFQEKTINFIEFISPKPGKENYWPALGQQLVLPFSVFHLGLGIIGWFLLFSKPRLFAKGDFLHKNKTHTHFNLLLISSFLSIYFFGIYTIPEYIIADTLSIFYEDGFFEYITAISYFISGILFVLIILYIRKDGQSRKKTGLVVIFLILALMCIFIAGEEISWGQRIFRWQTPEFFKNTNMQLETNFHNLLPRMVILEWGAGILFSIILFGVWIGISESLREKYSMIIPPNELRITAILAISSSGHGNPEVFEIMMSLLFLFSSISILNNWRAHIRRTT